MTLYREPQRCELCARAEEPGCRLLRLRMQAASTSVEAEAKKIGLKLPPGAELILCCPAWWRRGRSSGNHKEVRNEGYLRPDGP